MTKTDLTPHIETILNTISNTTVNREQIHNELQRFLEYGVPIEHATQTLIKKYGGSYTPPTTEDSTIAELTTPKSSINLLCRILTITPKTTTVKGEEKTLYFGMVADSTGSISFTAWEDFNLHQHDVIKITNAYTRSWQGTLKLNFGDRTKIEKTDPNKIPQESITPKAHKISELRGGMGLIELTVRILDIQQRETQSTDSAKTFFSGVIADESGKIPFTAWHDFNLKNDDTITISGAYIKTWKGLPQVTIDDTTTIKKTKKTVIDPIDIPSTPHKLYQLEEQQGGFDVQITGTIIEIREGSGIIQRCPQCNRTIQTSTCPIHGTITPQPDLRIKCIIDDGTGSIHAILNKETTEKLLDKTMDDLQNLHNTQGPQAVMEDLHTALFCQQFKFTGNVLSDDYGLTMITKNAEKQPFEAKRYYEQLKQEFGGT